MGIATMRQVDRVAASLGQLSEAPPVFESADNVCSAGTLFMVPALLSQGLLKGKEVYGSLQKGYYGLVSIVLLLCFMYLTRIKTPEQLKDCKVGELGRLLGLDRVAEVGCLREKIRELVEHKKAEQFNQALSQSWMEQEEGGICYVDGHVRTYHGEKAHLGKKYVSRQKLCLAGTTDYWVNSGEGLPYIVVSGELNEKLKEIIERQIVPMLLEYTQGQVDEEAVRANPQQERMTIVFDREGYDSGFFKRLWQEHRIAVITYRKNVKDQWDEKEFKPYTTTVINKPVTMALAMKESQIHGCEVREIRKLSEGGHQTAILTTHKRASIEEIAGRMFSRWSQENFFQYMMHNYGYDKLTQYGIEEVDPAMNVVNPSYKKCSDELRQLRAKASRIKAQLYAIMEKNLDKALDAEQVAAQSQLQQARQSLEAEVASLLQKRASVPYHISVGEMAVDERYTKLKCILYSGFTMFVMETIGRR